MSFSRDQLNERLREVDIEGKVVLDIGVQDKPTSRLTKGKPKAYYTLDIDPQWNPDLIADINNPEVANAILWKTARPVPESTTGMQETGFDVVFCIEVLEHCWDPVRAVANMSTVLRSGGVLYLSTPFIGPHHDVVDYLRFTDEWYKEVLPRVGFKEVKIHERIATRGRLHLRIFFETEGMRISKIRKMDFSSYTYPIGYIVEAYK